MIEKNSFDCLEKENSWESSNPLNQLYLQVSKNGLIKWNLLNSSVSKLAKPKSFLMGIEP